jgi:hypothetical protein
MDRNDMKFVSHRDRLEDDVRGAFHQAMEDTVGDADENAPVDEGTLHASITWDMISESKSNMKARFGSALRYAAIREKGGTIRPVRARLLAWRGDDGKMHFARDVHQKPGGKKGSTKHGKPYLKPAGERFGEFMDRALKRRS